MSRMLMAVLLVLVVTNVEVEVEEAGAELAVPVPVAGGVVAEPGDADHRDHAGDRTGPPEKLNHGSAEASQPQCSTAILPDRVARVSRSYGTTRGSATAADPSGVVGHEESGSRRHCINAKGGTLAKDPSSLLSFRTSLAWSH